MIRFASSPGWLPFGLTAALTTTLVVASWSTARRSPASHALEPIANPTRAAHTTDVGILLSSTPEAPSPPRSSAPRIAASPAPGSAGMRIAIDPETQRPVPPNPEQLHALERAAETDRSSAGLVVEALPGGGKKVHLQGRFLEYSVARIDGSGKIRVDCAQAADALELLETLPAPTAGPVEE